MSVPGAVATGFQRGKRLKIEEATRSLPPPHAGCPRGDPGPLRVLTSSCPMITFAKIKRMLRGEVSVRTAALEGLRRIRAALERRRERTGLATLDRQPARLRADFARLSPQELLEHFRSRQTPEFFPGFAAGAQQTATLQQELFSDETTK